MLSKVERLNCTLVDLSLPMLERAYERISTSVNKNNQITIKQGDIRNLDLPQNNYDIILAGAVLHHLLDDADWENTFAKLFSLLKPGGCLMISDLVTQENKILDKYIWEKYGDYLELIEGKDYRQKVLDYIEKEDSPRSLNFQLNLMRTVRFSSIEILHKNLCFAAFGGIK